MSYVSPALCPIQNPVMDYTWRTADGRPCARVTLSHRGAEIAFDDPGTARALAEACMQAADELEAMAAEGAKP